MNGFVRPFITLCRADFHFKEIFELMLPGGGSSKSHSSVQSGRKSQAGSEGQALSPAFKDFPCAARGQRVITTMNSYNFSDLKSHHSHALGLSLGDKVPDCPLRETKIAQK